MLGAMGPVWPRDIVITLKKVPVALRRAWLHDLEAIGSVFSTQPRRSGQVTCRRLIPEKVLLCRAEAPRGGALRSLYPLAWSSYTVCDARGHLVVGMGRYTCFELSMVPEKNLQRLYDFP